MRVGFGSSFWARSDRQGRFLLGPVPQGNYTLRIDTPGYYKVVRQLRVTRSNYQHCRSQIEVSFGFKVCDTWTYVKGFDKERDLEQELRPTK